MPFFIIEKKRLYSETEKSYVFLTSGYGGKFFNIPKFYITNKEESLIPYNPDHSGPAWEFHLTNSGWIKFKENIEKISNVKTD